MKKLITFVVATALCSPAFAQLMGSSNNNAPVVSQSVKVGDQSITLNYTSITWADGRTMKALMDKDNGARMRTRVNSSGPDNPLATFKSTVACKCGDLELPAGDYAVYYSITDDCKWQINFKAKDKDAKTMALPLSDSEHESKRLMMCLYAGDSGGAGAYVAFGTQSCMLEFEPVKEKKS